MAKIIGLPGMDSPDFPCEIQLNVHTFVALNSRDKSFSSFRRRLTGQAVRRKAVNPDMPRW